MGRRRLSKDSSSEGGNSVCSPTKSSSKDVPIRESAAVQSSNPELLNSARSNVFSNSLADQLKVRLEERRRNSDDNDIQDLAADVQKAVNIANESKPTDAGIIPPEYRTSFPGQIPSQEPSVPSSHVHNSLQLSNNIGESSSSDKKLHQWSTNPVEEWAKEQVCQWLLALGTESYITLFMDKTITGAALLNLDSSGLKDLGIKNKDDREKIKKKIKELKAHNDREKKDMEKEKSRREKLLKKAEKAIGKAKK